MMKAKGGLVVAILLVAAGAATAGYYAKYGRPRYALPTEPAPYNSIVIGAPESEVAGKIGQPSFKTANNRHEVKTEAQWRDIAAQADALEQRSSDPYGTMSPTDHAKLVDLRRTLEHRILDIWQYDAPKPQEAKILFEFDDQGKLLAATVNPIPHLSTPVAAVKLGKSVAKPVVTSTVK